MFHRTFVLMVAAGLALCQPVSILGDSGKHAEAPPELSALEFLIGDWQLTTSFAQHDGSRNETQARLEARYALGGFGVVIEETHGHEEGVGGTFVNHLLYTVHPKTRQIVGTSMNTLGNRKFYEMTVREDRIEVVQSGEMFGGRKGFNRQTLFEITPNRYRLRLDACDEAGECREGSYSYVAVRRGTVQTAP